MNYSLMGTPAEGCTGRLCRAIRDRWGVIKGITDKSYLVNSSHVAPTFKISAFDKTRIEVPYHELENAGHILYIQLTAEAAQNEEGFEELVQFMADSGAGYFAINHPVHRDPVCGYVGPLNPDGSCPRCGRKNGEGVPVSKLLSLTSYSPDPDYAVTAESLEQEDAVPQDLT
jgi:ribonucleoside-triphosphate reductase